MSKSNDEFSKILDGYLPDAEIVNSKDAAPDPKYVPNDLSIQARVDLHGQTVAQARKTVDLFLKESANKGLRKVLVIHGKGSGALQTAVKLFLEGHPLAGKREPAKREDGGSGALVVYIKIRK